MTAKQNYLLPHLVIDVGLYSDLHFAKKTIPSFTAGSSFCSWGRSPFSLLSCRSRPFPSGIWPRNLPAEVTWRLCCSWSPSGGSAEKRVVTHGNYFFLKIQYANSAEYLFGLTPFFLLWLLNCSCPSLERSRAGWFWVWWGHLVFLYRVVFC